MKQPNKNKKKKEILKILKATDPRLRAYQDSLKLYKKHKFDSDRFLKKPEDYSTRGEALYDYVDDDIMPIAISYSDGSPVYKKPTKPKRPKARIASNVTPSGLNIKEEDIKAKVPEMNPLYWNITKTIKKGGTGGSTTKRKIRSKEDLEKLKNRQKADEASFYGKNNTLDIQPIYKTNMATKNKRKKAIPKYVYGALISTGLSLLGGLSNNAKQKREQEEAEQLAMLSSQQQKQAQDKIRLADFKPEGDGGVDYYQEKGGKLKASPYATTGGKLTPLASDVELAEGRTHAQGGIELSKQGEPIAEIEDDETIVDDNMVLSDKLVSSTGKTYADESEKLGRQKGKIEKDMGKGDSITRFTNKRKLANIDKKQQALFLEQEMSKAQGTEQRVMMEGGDLNTDPNKKVAMRGRGKRKPSKEYLEHLNNLVMKGTLSPKVAEGLKTWEDEKIYLTKAANKAGATNFNPDKIPAKTGEYKYGGKMKYAEDGTDLDMPEDNFLTKAAPFLDNITNAILTKDTPEIPKPELERNVPLKTKYNALPQLNEVTKAVDAGSRFIKGATANSATARNEITSLRLRGADKKAGIKANKENIETQLANNNMLNSQQVSGRNLARINQNNKENMMRSNDIQTRVSNNISNLSDDIISERNFKAGQRYNKERSDIAAKMYQDDTTRRAILNNPTEIMLMKSNPDYGRQVLEQFKGTKEEARLRELLGIPLVNKVSTTIS